MELTSSSFVDGGVIPDRHAAGRPDPKHTVGFSDNLSPQLAWSGLPAGTHSLVLICHDPDAPSVGTDVNQPDRDVPADLPRTNFYHWVLVDLPPTVAKLAEGEYSHVFTVRGKGGPAARHDARQGLNDYTGWFKGDSDLEGEYFGYDGPFPPFNDARVHRYVFTLYALDVATCPVEGHFTAPQVLEAIQGHVLAQASVSASYTLNPRLRR
jgi:Raf kinase inhibitor-like YbhB/YbcL family protein